MRRRSAPANLEAELRAEEAHEGRAHRRETAREEELAGDLVRHMQRHALALGHRLIADPAALRPGQKLQRWDNLGPAGEMAPAALETFKRLTVHGGIVTEEGAPLSLPVEDFTIPPEEAPAAPPAEKACCGSCALGGVCDGDRKEARARIEAARPALRRLKVEGLPRGYLGGYLRRNEAAIVEMVARALSQRAGGHGVKPGVGSSPGSGAPAPVEAPTALAQVPNRAAYPVGRGSRMAQYLDFGSAAAAEAYQQAHGGLVGEKAGRFYWTDDDGFFAFSGIVPSGAPVAPPAAPPAPQPPTMLRLRGLSDAEYGAFKAEFKRLRIPASFSINRTKGNFGAVSVHPKKGTDGQRHFTEGQVETIRRWLLDRGFYKMGLADFHASVFTYGGFGYLHKVVAPSEGGA